MKKIRNTLGFHVMICIGITLMVIASYINYEQSTQLLIISYVCAIIFGIIIPINNDNTKGFLELFIVNLLITIMIPFLEAAVFLPLLGNHAEGVFTTLCRVQSISTAFYAIIIPGILAAIRMKRWIRIQTR